jgi:hypothetical protein
MDEKRVGDETRNYCVALAGRPQSAPINVTMCVQRGKVDMGEVLGDC